jgi:hypothetical protein
MASKERSHIVEGPWGVRYPVVKDVQRYDPLLTPRESGPSIWTLENLPAIGKFFESVTSSWFSSGPGAPALGRCPTAASKNPEVGTG